LTKKNQKVKKKRLLPHMASRPGVFSPLPYCAKGRLIALIFVGDNTNKGMRIFFHLHFFACPKKRSKEKAPQKPTCVLFGALTAHLYCPTKLRFAPFVDACPGVK
jgi:hypothetical protein